jgi:hypothetical protein
MDFEDLCEKCKKTKFDERGIALIHGLKSLICVNCKEHAVNYPEGQLRLCHACARKLGLCVMCGNGV